MPNGLVIYDDEVPKLLKINKNHFYGMKPDCNYFLNKIIEF